MITVTPIQEKDEQARLAALCGVPFEIDFLAYRATDEAGAFAGICQFSMNSEGGHLWHLASPIGKPDDEVLFVLGRATLNFIDLCGVKTAFFEGDAANHTLLTRIGFQPDEKRRYSVSLDGFFTHPCQHEKANTIEE